MNVILLHSNQWHVSVTHVPSAGWWEHESKYNYNVSRSLHS